MVRQELIPIERDSPDHMLTFDGMVYRGYDTEAELNKKESVSIHRYPLYLYVAYKQILRQNVNPRIQYIADIQRYSTLLGHAKLLHMPVFKEITLAYEKACDSENLYIQDSLDNTKSYTYMEQTKCSRKAIKTLFFIKESLDTRANILGINSTDLAVLCSLIGIESAAMPKSTLKRVKNECDFFRGYIDHIKQIYYNIK